MSERKIVITGMGAISPAGVGVGALWEAVRDGRSCAERIEVFDVSQSASKIAAAARGFDPAASGIAVRDATRMDRVTQFSVAASRAAMLDAGL